AVVLCAAALASSIAVHAKGDTTRIAISGETLAAEVQIVDPAITSQFNVWSGPGTSVSGIAQLDGFIADWRAGVAQPPAGLRHYDVSFYTKGRSASGSDELVYVVSYDCNPSGREGYVYLPGGRINLRSIYRGPEYEGHWFRATEAWRRAADRAIASATRCLREP